MSINYKTFIESKTFRRALAAFGILAVLVLVFEAGEMVGYHEAGFSYRWGDNYYRVFGGPHLPFGQNKFGGITGAHGVIGKVLSIQLPTITVSGQDGIEKAVMITDDTMVRRGRDAVDAHTLAVGDQIVVVGSPKENGEIEAELVRVIAGNITPVGSATTTSGMPTP